VKHGWPSEALGLQSAKWGFDLVAFRGETHHIIGEVKKTDKELAAVARNLARCCAGDHDADFLKKGSSRNNAHKKFDELVSIKPTIMWLVGPGGLQHVLRPAFRSDGLIDLVPATPDSLDYSPG
jgi:hypothetical protein